MSDYKYYAMVLRASGKIINLVASTVKPENTELCEVLEITYVTFNELAYNSQEVRVS